MSHSAKITQRLWNSHTFASQGYVPVLTLTRIKEDVKIKTLMLSNSGTIAYLTRVGDGMQKDISCV